MSQQGSFFHYFCTAASAGEIRITVSAAEITPPCTQGRLGPSGHCRAHSSCPLLTMFAHHQHRFSANRASICAVVCITCIASRIRRGTGHSHPACCQRAQHGLDYNKNPPSEFNHVSLPRYYWCEKNSQNLFRRADVLLEVLRLQYHHPPRTVRTRSARHGR